MKQIKIKMKGANTTLLIVGFLLLTSVSFAQTTATKATATADAASMTKEKQQSITPQLALQKLKDGNSRFVSGKTLKRDLKKQVVETSKGQYPHSVILSCLDSRTSSELIFDQGLGDVFNARVAGNFENTDILGSMEFACKAAGAKLVLVVGHTNCGAVKGACDNVQLGNLTNVIEQIKPATQAVKNVEGERNSKNHDYVEAVAKENVLLTIADIRQRSPLLQEMESKGEIMIVGAMYNLETGAVDFY